MRRLAFIMAIISCLGLLAEPYVLENGDKIRVRGLGLKRQVKIIFGADTHFSEADERDAEYIDNYKRMANFKPAADCLEKIVAKAANADLLVLGGDIISFPTAANVDKILDATKSLSCQWAYITGNHDWHFEGLPGTEAQLRSEWIEKRLKPLYNGRDPLAFALDIKGLKVLCVDNGTHEILPEQLDFLKKELADGKPAVLALHIPLYVPGHGLDFGCGHPDWNEAHDPHAKIEGRLPWPKEGHTQTTKDFCETVWSSPNILGVIAGHTHVRTTDFYRGKFQVVAPRGANGDCLSVTFE